MPATAPRKVSAKPKVIEYLYQLVEAGNIPGGVVKNDDIVAAIRATNADLSTANPANFLKDIIRTENANENWPDSLKEKRITARQRYGQKRVFQFIAYPEGATEPFPNRFLADKNTPQYRIQAASIPFAARRLGRTEENWITQIAVYVRLVETQLSVFSPSSKRLRDVTHMQMGMKTQPEIDAVYLASYGVDESPESETGMHLLITCEAKQAGERLLEDQIKEQVAKAMEQTLTVKTPKIEGVKPMAVKVAKHKFRTGEERGIYVVEFNHIMREDFEKLWRPTKDDEERLYSMPLEKVSDAIYRIMPSVGGVNG